MVESWKIRPGPLLGLLVLVVGCVAWHPPALAEKPDNKALWERIAPFFSPPPEYADDYGDFRPVLKFDDGRPVKSADDWQKRRQEILKDWHEMMGPWPPLTERPKVAVLDKTRRHNFDQFRVRFDLLPGQPTEGYLLVPDGQGRRPAVLVVYYDPETGIGLNGEDRDFALQLARRGFVSLSIGTPRTRNRPPETLYYPTREHSQLQPLSALACASANAWYVLAGRPEVDPKRIGVVGHSYGGKWAMFSSCLFDKFACAAWSDPGVVFDETRPSVNYWEPWYLGYEPAKSRKRGIPTKDNPAFGLYPKLVKQGHDLHELQTLMAPRPFLVSGGSEDTPKRWRALNHSVAVNRLLGFENRVAMTNREKHSPNPESNEQLYDFFEYFLKPGAGGHGQGK